MGGNLRYVENGNEFEIIFSHKKIKYYAKEVKREVVIHWDYCFFTDLIGRTRIFSRYRFYWFL